MKLILLFVVGMLAVSIPAALILSCRSGFARITASILALGIAAFCGFGFLASFEPSDLPHWPWRVGYGILGIGSLVTAVLGLKAGLSRSRPSGNAD